MRTKWENVAGNDGGGGEDIFHVEGGLYWGRKDIINMGRRDRAQ